MQQRLSNLPKLRFLKPGVSRFRAGHPWVLLLVVISVWFSSLALAEFDGDGKPEQTLNVISWPMLPGESLGKLATLFYPKNKAMQRNFIAKTRELNRELIPALDANMVFSQPAMLIIPDLKALSHQAPPPNPQHRKPAATNLRMSYLIESIVTPAMRAQYEGLIQQNEFLKRELQGMHQRLSGIQDNITQLKDAVLAFIRTESLSKMRPALQPARMLAKAEAAPQPVQRHAEISTILVESTWTRTLIEFLMIIVGLILAFVAWFWVRKRVIKLIEAATNKQFDAMDQTSFHTIGASSFEFTKSGIFEKAQNDILSVEEINSVVDEARILVSMDRPAKAISVLLNYVGAHPKVSLRPWLYLLDLYRSQDRKDEFLAVAKRLHTVFNVMTPQWEETEAPMVVANSLEEFPHIISQLEEICTTGQSQEYLAGLLEDNREGERAGFSLNVMEDIMLLKDVLEAREPAPEAAAA